MLWAPQATAITSHYICTTDRPKTGQIAVKQSRWINGAKGEGKICKSFWYRELSLKDIVYAKYCKDFYVIQSIFACRQFVFLLSETIVFIVFYHKLPDDCVWFYLMCVAFGHLHVISTHTVLHQVPHSKNVFFTDYFTSLLHCCAQT